MAVAVTLMLAMLLSLAPTARAALPSAVEGQELPSLAPMLDRVTPAVVNIATEGRVRVQQNPLLNDPFFRRFFNIPDMPMERRTQSLGSGVIVDAERGLVLTNNHVIANADEIAVTLRDGRTLSAELVGSDPDTDVAVIKLPAENLTQIPVTDSDALRVGDFVVAIGNPFGVGQTVTSGIVSALGRTGLGIVGYENFIQTDASINPGNSGGALVNLRGELVGINTAIFSQHGGNIGIGFAIPINMAKQVMEQLVEHGDVRRGIIGAQLQDLTPELADAFGIREKEGAVLVSIAPDSPAEKAGLKAGDVVTRVNGKRVRNAADLRNHVGLLRVGDEVTLEVVSNGKKRTVRTTVTERESISATGTSVNPKLAGASFGEIEEGSREFGQVDGVRVVDVERNSRAWANGLRPGDIVTSVNRQPVRNLEEFMTAVNVPGQMLFQVRRGNIAAFIVIK